MMSQDFLHAVTINVLYACVAVLTFVIIERMAYYGHLTRRRARIAKSIEAAVKADAGSPLPDLPPGNDVLTRAMQEYVDVQRKGEVTRSRIEDLSAALFLRVDGSINRGLWILDTIVTAAPLLGLLGTILGIMDTFQALSAGGVSDPSAVSRGIGSALLATAIGIGTALYGLVGHNILHRLGECITEDFKSFLLETTR
ncbi:MotA/TolQ/ExbB proton channel family protein [Methyloversatilis thermotolerans]|uniref:MotA/TolQ/ExbB proton channel family protein n=1 Tax=Methyloversatilis thermotolerans TaxID=1346290 RepID=UPI000376B263|nr:MotA/TolQ/ExbB proton channel family protein [Methyloversatilis thermotolerans]